MKYFVDEVEVTLEELRQINLEYSGEVYWGYMCLELKSVDLEKGEMHFCKSEFS